MTILQGAILGLVQGLGEFLPISSSGHLLLTRLLMGIPSDNPAFRLLDILLHVGTLIPVVLVFWKDWIDMLLHPIRNHTLLHLFCASLPALLFYVVFDFDAFSNGWFLGPCFLLTALLLIGMDVAFARKRTHMHVHLPQAIAMGFMQGVGLLSGVSRSGSTMFGGAVSGVERKAVARFSFMMSLPAILASLLVEGKHALEENLFAYLDLAPTVVAILVAMITGYLAIRLMLSLITRIPMSCFAVYMLLLAIAYMALQLLGFPLFPAFEIPAGLSILKF